ncbi:MAG TPA: exodeoxyribonuclease V subunit gamma [Mycobacterium sp.]|nr:exodeoxyribonuclease V subunit gamma [Mycobacterium sp.]
MALHIHRAERTDLLADGLGALLSTPLPDPFAEELVLVSARGMERWLSQRLSHILGRGNAQDGVCAGISFRSPASLIAEITGTTDDDPWSPDTMTWPLLDAIDASCRERWCRTLATHLGHFDTDPDEKELRQGRRYAVARRLARLFAAYAKQRPQLLVDWLDKNPTDGVGGDLDHDLHWQPHLWRGLVDRVDVDPPHIRHAKTVARLNEGPSDLPSRLSLFGHTRLPATDIELLEALSTHHDLHLWLPHPSDDLWRNLTDAHDRVPRTQDPSRHHAHHPLLDTLGRDLRELQRSLPKGDTDEFIGAAMRPDSLLGWLQSDICANEVRPKGRMHTAADRSVQVHSCHGAARQIDVLREVLLGLLQDDPTLEPRDILVMCPDIETYAPLIVAAFGLGDIVGDIHPAHHLRVRLADRSLTQTNPLFAVAAQILDIAGSRGTASQVLDLAEAGPVRACFGFTDDDLQTISAWVRQSGIRWGFDAPQRGPFGLDKFLHNTWRFGIDRILTGVAMSDDSQAWLGHALPLDDVGSNKVELAGRFAEFIARLTTAFERLAGPHSLSEWMTALREGVASLTTVDEGQEWQSAQLQREFSKILQQARSRADTELRLADIRALLADHLSGRPTRANFRTGTLTVCTMVPMRSVPHRVVCLVGLDDGVFPRLDLVDGDDALDRLPMTGERDIRSEDRQLLLDAVCAATETLVVTYNGTDEHSGHHRPAAVPLLELLDALDATTDDPIRKRIVTEHPLQPFDIKNVERGKLIPGEPFTFDPTALRAARAAVGERSAPTAFFSDPLPASPTGDVSLDDLLGFFKHPVRGFFRELDYTLPWEVEAVEDAMPVEITALQEWEVGDRLLTDLMRGTDLEFATGAEWRRGTLPPGRLGWRKALAISDCAADLAMAALRPRGAHRATGHDIDVDLGSRRVTGTVMPVYGDRIISVTYSRLAAKQILQSWISLVALKAQMPDREWAAFCVGRDAQAVIKVRMFRPPAEPTTVLRDLVAIFDAGRREPLPLPLKTSYAWAQKRHEGREPRWFANSKWESPRNMAISEDADKAHVEVWGSRAPLTKLLAAQPHPGEEFDGEDTRLGALAARLWLPVFDAEEQV